MPSGNILKIVKLIKENEYDGYDDAGDDPTWLMGILISDG